MEVVTQAERVENEFLRLYDSINWETVPERKRADVIDSFWNDIYKAVFKPMPGDKIYNNCKSKLKTYDINEVEEVTEIYIKLCKRYGGNIKINQFGNLTGIHPSTLWLWSSNNNTNGYIFNLNNSAITEEENSILYINNIGNNVVVYNGNSKYMSYANTEMISSLRFDVIKKLRAEMQDSNTNGLSNDTMGHTIRANNEEELGKLYDAKRIMHQAVATKALSVDQLPKLGQIVQNPQIEQMENQDIVVDEQ